MNRCQSFTSRLSLVVTQGLLSMAGIACIGLTIPPNAAQAQTVGREFPQKALRAILVVTAPPEVMLDGKATRLSPGARIHDAQNMLVMSGNLVGQRLLVNFILENTGLVHEVWILSPEEAAQKRARVTPERNYIFSSEINTTPHDDGKTPFNLLPKFPQQ